MVYTFLPSFILLTYVFSLHQKLLQFGSFINLQILLNHLTLIDYFHHCLG